MFRRKAKSRIPACDWGNDFAYWPAELVPPDSLPLRAFWPLADGQLRWLSPGYRVFRRMADGLNLVDPGLKRTLAAFGDALQRGGIKLNPADEVEFIVQTEKLTGTKFRIVYLSGLGVTKILQLDGEHKYRPDELIQLAHASTVVVDYFIFPHSTDLWGKNGVSGPMMSAVYLHFTIQQ